MLIRIVPVVLLVSFAASPAALAHRSATREGGAQSFDCAKAQTRIEKMICGDRSIADLDENLGRYYAAARAGNARAASCLQADQTAWLKSKRDACADASCVKSAYLNRLAELDPLQPGATAIRNFELPIVPSLVWVIPPAADTVAAPSNPRAKPFEATGAIVDDIATNANSEGIVLRTADGKRIPLMMLMFLESPSQEHLQSLAKERNATFRARGFAATDPGGKTFFEPSRCVFLHRMPAAAADSEKDMDAIRLRVVTQGKVCGDPDRPCPGFEPNELSFSIATPFNFDRGRDKSQPFYAVILSSGALCGIQDTERVKAQKAFPRSKVFLHRYFCNDFSDNVTYSNINEKSGFIAVYAGETDADAQKMLAQAKAAGYSTANIRRSEVIVVYQIE
jgi:uncharacterized protein